MGIFKLNKQQFSLYMSILFSLFAGRTARQSWLCAHIWRRAIFACARADSLRSVFSLKLSLSLFGWFLGHCFVLYTSCAQGCMSARLSHRVISLQSRCPSCCLDVARFCLVMRDLFAFIPGRGCCAGVCCPVCQCSTCLIGGDHSCAGICHLYPCMVTEYHH